MSKLSDHIRGISFAFSDQGRKDNVRKIADQVKDMEKFIETISSDFDCDSDAHRYNTFCRCCEAEKLLNKINDYRLF